MSSGSTYQILLFELCPNETKTRNKKSRVHLQFQYLIDSVPNHSDECPRILDVSEIYDSVVTQYLFKVFTYEKYNEVCKLLLSSRLIY